MKRDIGRMSGILLALTFLILLVSCDGTPAPRASTSLRDAKAKTKEFASLAGKKGGADGWRRIASFISDDFEFRDAEGNVTKGAGKDAGVRPLRSSLMPEGLLRYEQVVGDARDLGGGLVEVDADIKLEIESAGGVKTVEWPACFSWREKDGKWILESVEYVEAPKTTQKDAAPHRSGGGDAAEKSAASIEKANRVGDHSAGTCIKVKQLIQRKVDDLSQKNRSGERK